MQDQINTQIFENEMAISKKMGIIVESEDISNGQYYMDLELFDGEELSKILKTRAGDIELIEKIDTAISLIEEWQRHQEYGVLHCNLNPENIYLLPSGEIRWVNYRFACDVSGQEVQEATDLEGRVFTGKIAVLARVGEPKYMAPEIGLYNQATGRCENGVFGDLSLYSSASEAFAIGRILCEDLLLLAECEYNPEICLGLDVCLRNLLSGSMSLRPSAENVLQALFQVKQFLAQAEELPMALPVDYHVPQPQGNFGLVEETYASMELNPENMHIVGANKIVQTEVPEAMYAQNLDLWNPY